jgi:uncharacterized repeat protein (TIGR03803 family)
MRFSPTRSPFFASTRFIALLTLAFAALSTATFAQTPTTIYNFTSAAGNVAVPTAYGVTVQGRDGNLYSATGSGGANSAGGIYVVTPAGTLTTIYSFPGSYVGCQAGLALGNDGNFYGDCFGHGTFGYGLLYKVTPAGVYTELHDFSNTGGDGGQPNGPPVAAKDGNLYGTTQLGGANGNGTIYKIAPNGAVTIFYSFLGGAGGSTPNASLIQGTDGNLYGSTSAGGTNGSGTIFKITTKGKLTVLHAFNFTDGTAPDSALVQGTDGNFYGATFQGGTNNFGVVFKITASGKFTLLHNFDVNTDGSYCFAAMVQGTDGNFYGTTNDYQSTQDTIYKVSLKGVYSVVYQFDGTSSTLGFSPANALVQNTNGLLYGATSFSASGGTGGEGTIYTLNIGAKPFARLTAASGLVGSSVSIFGQGFSSSSVVKFDGVQATGVVLQGTTYITVPVPAGALTGSVSVTTGSTTLTSNSIFKVLPKVKSFTPASGSVGTSVIITGASLTQASKVTFGGVIATNFTVNSDTQITAIVPTGAKTGKIAVTTKGGASSSAASFTVQ